MGYTLLPLQEKGNRYTSFCEQETSFLPNSITKQPQ